MLKNREQLTEKASKLRRTPLEANGKCCSCDAWVVANTQVDANRIEMQCGRSFNMGCGPYGEDGRAIITSASFGCIFWKARTQ